MKRSNFISIALSILLIISCIPQKKLEYLHSDKQLEHMFVDSISSLRHYILTHFYMMHSFITFHDYNKTGRHNHWRGGVTCPEKYEFYVDHTYPQHTGIWIHKDRIGDMAKLRENFALEVAKYTTKAHTPKLVHIKDYNGNL